MLFKALLAPKGAKKQLACFRGRRPTFPLAVASRRTGPRPPASDPARGPARPKFCARGRKILRRAWAKILAKFLAKIWTGSARGWPGPNFGSQIWANLAQIWPGWGGQGRPGPGFGPNLGPNSGTWGRPGPGLGQIWAHFEPNWGLGPPGARFWAKIWSILGQIWVKIGLDLECSFLGL